MRPDMGNGAFKQNTWFSHLVSCSREVGAAVRTPALDMLSCEHLHTLQAVHQLATSCRHSSKASMPGHPHMHSRTH